MRTPLLCSLLQLVVGFSAFGISYVAPFLARDYGLTFAQLGVIFTATVIASLFGAIGIAPWSDRVGRRPVLLLAMLLVTVPSALISIVQHYPLLIGLRFIVGLGLGAALPVAVTLVSECAPVRHRSLSMTATGSAVVAGMALAGLAAGALVPSFGWKSVLHAGSATAVVAFVALWLWLPESPRPQPLARGRLRLSAEVRSELLQRRTLWRSLLLGLLLSMSYLVVNFTAYWLPSILLGHGVSVEGVGLIGFARQSAMVLLGLAVGWCMDRAGIGRVLASCHLLAVLMFFGVAAPGLLPWLALGLLMSAVCVLSAALAGSLAHVTSFYSPAVRATALGWVQGVARLLGGSLGVLIGGALLSAGWRYVSLSMVLGAAAALGTVALLFTLRARSGQMPGAS